MQKDNKRELLFNVLGQLTKSKTVTVNALILGIVIAVLNFKGIELSAEELAIVGSVISAAWFGVNVFLRSITKKPLMEKNSLKE